MRPAGDFFFIQLSNTRDPGNAQACGLVYGGNEAQRGDPERVESYLFVRGAGKASGAV